MKKSLAILATALMLATSATIGCAPKAPENAAPVSDTSVDGIKKPAYSGEKLSLNILNWGDYISDEALAMFRAEYPNIEINYETMGSNEEMLVMLSQENSIYDICFPSDYIIQKLIDEDLLAEIDYTKLPHSVNIDDRFKGLEFDTTNKYSLPYLWGTVGILYNKTLVPDASSWDVLWDKTYERQILMYDSVRDTLGVSLKRLGYSMNTENLAEITQAETELINQKPLVLAYGIDDLRDKLINESAALAVVYSGDAIFAISENENLAYSIPKEGSNIWFDNVVLMKQGKNKEAAHLFIDFVCRSDIAKMNTEYIGYSTPNKAAMAKLDDSFKNDPVYNPSPEVTATLETFKDLKPEVLKLYSDAWMKIKTSK